ncbi:MAG: hypothetical protein WKF58_04085 [Ilumatobacteraceae bacterium]
MRHFLGGDDTDEEVEGEPEWPPDRLGHHERREVGSHRTERRDDRRGPGDDVDHPATSDPVGEQRRRERDDDAAANDGSGDPDAPVAHLEVVGSEVDRLREQAC